MATPRTTTDGAVTDELARIAHLACATPPLRKMIKQAICAAANEADANEETFQLDVGQLARTLQSRLIDGLSQRDARATLADETVEEGVVLGIVEALLEVLSVDLIANWTIRAIERRAGGAQ